MVKFPDFPGQGFEALASDALGVGGAWGWQFRGADGRFEVPKPLNLAF